MAFELVNRLPYNHPYRWDGTLFGGPNLWRPSYISTGLDLWLDASDSSTITLNGSTVSQWSDKSGNNRHFTQPTAANQPGYLTDGLNGCPILTFDGVNDFLDGGNILPATNGITTFLMVRQKTITTTSSAPYFSRISGTLTNGAWIVRGMLSSQPTLGAVAALQIAAGFTATKTDTVDSNWYLTGIRYSSTANQLQAMRSSVSGGIITTTGTPADPGLPCRIAANSGGTISYANIDVAEIIVVLSGLATLDPTRQLIEGYMSWKYGLQGNLPVGHPYKNAPPTI